MHTAGFTMTRHAVFQPIVALTAALPAIGMAGCARPPVTTATAPMTGGCGNELPGCSELYIASTLPVD